MTAIGLLMFTAGLLFVLLIDDEDSWSATISKLAAGAGFGMFVGGLTIWLWMVAP